MTGVTGRLRKGIAAYGDFFLLFKFSSCSHTALYEASISKYLFHDIFEPSWKSEMFWKSGIGDKLVTVLYSRQTDRICYFFLFPTEYRVVLHCGKSEVDARGRRRLPFKPIIIRMHMAL